MNTRFFSRVWLMGAMFLIVMGSSPVLALTISDNFDSNTLNTSLWTVFSNGPGPYVEVVNQRLEITIPGTTSGGVGAGIIANLPFGPADYEAQIHYELLTWPANCGAGGGMGNWGASIGRASIPTPPFGGEVINASIGGSNQWIPNSSLSGELKLVFHMNDTYGGTGIGPTYLGYYYNPSLGDWTEVGRWGAGWVPQIELSATSIGVAWTHQDVRFALDNFQLTTPVPIPPGFLLLGSGLLGLAGWRLRNR